MNFPQDRPAPCRAVLFDLDGVLIDSTPAHARAYADVMARHALAPIDYVSVADPDTLDELDDVGSRALASLAVRIGDTRLIDNTTLEGSR
mgnify:CR=1 FL=1